jgi:hypothetical protein
MLCHLGCLFVLLILCLFRFSSPNLSSRQLQEGISQHQIVLADRNTAQNYFHDDNQLLQRKKKPEEVALRKKLTNTSLKTSTSSLVHVDNLHCNDPLRCYLNSLVIPVPDSCQEMKTGTVCIQETSCSNIDIASLPSYYQHPHRFDMSIRGFAAVCSGKYTYGSIIHHTKSFTATISDSAAAFNLTILQNQSLPYYPTGIDFSYCLVNPFHLKVDKAQVSF